MKTLRRLQTYMGHRRILLPGAMILSAFSSLLGVVPLVLIWLIVRSLLSGDSRIPDDSVHLYAWWALGTAVGSIAVYFAALTLSHLAAFRAEVNMRRRAMERIVKLPLGFFDANTTGRIRKIIDDNASVTHSFLAHQLPDLSGSMLTPLTAFVLIFVFDWRMGAACLVPIAAAMGIMGFMMGKRGRYFMKSYMNSLEEMNTEAVEYVRGIPVVKVFQQTVFSFKNFLDSILRYKDMVYRYTLMWEKPMSAYVVIIHSFAYVLIPVALVLLLNEGDLPTVFVNLFFYILLTPLFGQSVMKSMYMNHALGQAGEALDRMESLTSVEPLPIPACPVMPAGHDIEFRDVCFRYPGSERNAVDHVSFALPEGSTFALVGPSGGGKTTIARLVPRFWDTASGQVLIGGADVKTIDPQRLMSRVSFVFQDNRLFKTHIRDNVLFGNPQASEEDVHRALKQAQCEEIIERLPLGLDTRIGAEGTYLSGGEQQRIALARAFIKDAPIVVLDEATSFADPENEYLIQRALRELARGKTVLMIAHRLSSVIDVDRILVIDQGRIVEKGNHAELLQNRGLYAHMWREYQQAVQWTLHKEVRGV